MFRSSTTRKDGVSALFSSSQDSTEYDDECDVLVLGSGPAARAIATLVSSSSGGSSGKLDVLMADKNFDREWAPNYGVWEDEWQSICNVYQKDFGRILGDEVIDRKWQKTDCYFGGSFDIPTEQRLRVDRPYYRIAKNQLQDALTPAGEYRILKANHASQATNVNLYTPPASILHDDTGTTIQLLKKDGQNLSVRTKLIVDCTGHETELVLKDGRAKSIPPGFQIAYGCLVNVKDNDAVTATQIGPYDKEAMTLFDYRTDHFEPDSQWEKKAERSPTFMYSMPLKDNQIFFEETSLVARPALSFQECKDRCFRRLEHLGIEVIDIEEEEFCYIPMGGPLPEKNQRIIGFGGAAAMVHPSTGYNLCRNMMGAVNVAKTIKAGLTSNNKNLDKIAATAYDAIWSPENIQQRNFAVFGGEFLMKQNVQGLRGFFDGFFRLPLEYWAGFLAGWPGLPNNEKHETWLARITFGLLFVSKLPLKVATDMLISIASYSITEGVALPQSVTPLLGKPESYLYDIEKKLNVGDVAAKTEAVQMIQESSIQGAQVPVAFSSSETETKSEVDESIVTNEIISKVESEEDKEEMEIEDSSDETIVADDEKSFQ